MKLDKAIVQRRLDLLEQEGVIFKTNVNVGETISADELKSSFDALLICTGATQPRDLKIPGRTLNGIHFAMEYLRGSTSALLSGGSAPIDAKDKNVVGIGGGDTGTDCLGTAMRQGCKSLVNDGTLWNSYGTSRQVEVICWPLNAWWCLTLDKVSKE